MKRWFLSLILAAGYVFPVYAQQCLHGRDESPEQQARRRQALTATRTVNNIQANQPGAATKQFLRHDELATSPFAQKQASEFFRSLDFRRGQDLIAGWELTVDVTQDGYWFMVRDKTDPCGFAYISNTDGLIYTAEPIR
jgi:hypothetical protein